MVRGTDGLDSIDISTFMKQTGFTALDQGFVNTASTRSEITYIDGDKGILRYRGYAIEDVAKNSTYLEVAWLLIYGELPTADQLGEFDEKIRRHTLLHEDLRRFFDALPHDAHPMSVSSSAVSALSTYYQDSLDVRDPEQIEISTIRLLAKLPVIAAYAHKKSLGQAFLYPDNSLSFVDNFLKLNFGTNGGTLRGQPGALEGARPPADPARRPRAERLDLDCATRRLDGSEHLRVGLRGHQRAVRTTSRWR